MRIIGGDKRDEHQEENDAVSLCCLFAGEQTFGIDTSKIREVLGERELQRVPMSPGYIAGVVPYRGRSVDDGKPSSTAWNGDAARAMLCAGNGGRRGFGAVWPCGGCGGRSGDDEPQNAGCKSMHARGARKVVVRWRLQDGWRVDGAVGPAEAEPVAAVGDGTVQNEYEWRRQCEP